MDKDHHDTFFEIAQKLHEKYHLKRDRPSHVVVTRGSKSVVVSSYMPQTGKHQQRTVDVPRLENILIKDTNGAGDSFVGGFLS